MSNSETVKAAKEVRTEPDRRELTWRTMFHGFLRSRRRDTRRELEMEPIYTDWHHPWLFFLGTGTMILSCMDAFFTLQLLDRGAMEINPLMAMVISRSTAMFASTKIAMTGVGILVLVFLSRVLFLDKFRTGIILTMIFSIYACLVCYEFVFLLQQL